MDKSHMQQNKPEKKYMKVITGNKESNGCSERQKKKRCVSAVVWQCGVIGGEWGAHVWAELCKLCDFMFHTPIHTQFT